MYVDDVLARHAAASSSEQAASEPPKSGLGPDDQENADADEYRPSFPRGASTAPTLAMGSRAITDAASRSSVENRDSEASRSLAETLGSVDVRRAFSNFAYRVVLDELGLGMEAAQRAAASVFKTLEKGPAATDLGADSAMVAYWLAETSTTPEQAPTPLPRRCSKCGAPLVRGNPNGPSWGLWVCSDSCPEQAPTPREPE